jgi:hypothetical protein
MKMTGGFIIQVKENEAGRAWEEEEYIYTYNFGGKS